MTEIQRKEKEKSYGNANGVCATDANPAGDQGKISAG